MEEILHSTISSLLECSGLTNIQGLEVGGYFDTMMSKTYPVYYCGLLVSFGAVIIAWIWSRKNKDAEKTSPIEITEQVVDEKDCDVKSEEREPFEISPTDECEFVPLVSFEEDKRISREIAPKTKYIPLDSDNPSVIESSMSTKVNHHVYFRLKSMLSWIICMENHQRI